MRKEERAEAIAYLNTTHILAGVDNLGRRIDPVIESNTRKQIGVFYFLWLGASLSEELYDVSKILEKDPRAGASSEAWVAAGGGDVIKWHW